MDNLLGIRLGKCKSVSPIPAGFAAAGAIANSGKLIDVTRMRINVSGDAGTRFHSGYAPESILSTTLPILSLSRKYHSVVYMTSRKFVYSDLCKDALMTLREGMNNSTVLTELNDTTYLAREGADTREVGEVEARGIIERELSRPMSCAICDWGDVPLFSDASRNIEATLWWYPMKIQSPLSSTAPGDSTSYYARAYGEDSSYCMVVGAYKNIKDSTDVDSRQLTSMWRTYCKLLQSQTCDNGECFSCTYLRASLHVCGLRKRKNEPEELRLLMNI